MRKKLFTSLGLLLIITFIAEMTATPELALWSGNRCSECHIDAQGSGMRNEFGWVFGKDASFFTPEELGLGSLFDLDKKNYSIGNGWLALGTDFRIQTARSHKTDDAVRKVFPMQASLYANSNPYDWIMVEAKYNFGPKIFNGQTLWNASISLKPFDELPALRIGRFQPAMGLKDCDMTSLDRRVAAPDGTEVMISVDYAEYGIELVYESLDWLTINAGIFDSKMLREVTVFGGQEYIVGVEGNPTFNLRFLIWPSAYYFDLPDMYFGASTLINGKFIYNNAFAGIAITDEIHLYGKYANTNLPMSRYTCSYIAGMNYVPYKGVILGLRGEIGKTTYFFTGEEETLTTNQIVANAKILLLPYFEIIPEYRWLDTEEFHSLRWVLQMHLYY
jgi:hypothetical protein